MTPTPRLSRETRVIGVEADGRTRLAGSAH